MTNAALSVLQPIRARLEQVFGPELFAPSPRERALASILLTIFALYVALNAWDLSQSAYDRALAADAALADARRAQSTTTQDTAFLVERQVSRVREYAFTDQTLAIAQVKAQSQLEAMMTAAQIPNGRVIVDAEPQGGGEIKIATFTLEGGFDWNSFTRFCATLAQAEQSISVTSVAIDQRTIGRFRMRVRAPLAIANGA